MLDKIRFDDFTMSMFALRRLFRPYHTTLPGTRVQPAIEVTMIDVVVGCHLWKRLYGGKVHLLHVIYQSNVCKI
jgi:hypothetical protein